MEAAAADGDLGLGAFYQKPRTAARSDCAERRWLQVDEDELTPPSKASR
jgi:hypothetical protein